MRGLAARHHVSLGNPAPLATRGATSLRLSSLLQGAGSGSSSGKAVTFLCLQPLQLTAAYLRGRDKLKQPSQRDVIHHTSSQPCEQSIDRDKL